MANRVATLYRRVTQCRERDATFPFRSKQSRTAHISKTAEVFYRHHPLCGEHVEVIRRYRAGTVMIVVSDGTHCLIPHWMLDAAACSAVSDEVRPRISVDALRALRDLLDAQTLSFQLTPDSRGTSSINGGSNDVETTDRPATVDVSLGRGPRRVERLPSTQQAQCRELWAQLLRAVAAANETRIERSASDEREDS